jgi:hypothetical protein
MLVRLLSNQIREYEDVINETIDKTIPEYQETLRSKLFEELLFGIAQCWALEYNGKFSGIYLTKIVEDTACGGKSCVLLAGYSPVGILNGSAAVYEAWKTVSEFALGQGCDRISMFTNNPEVEKYLHMFDKLWETKYYQIRLNKEV